MHTQFKWNNIYMHVFCQIYASRVHLNISLSVRASEIYWIRRIQKCIAVSDIHALCICMYIVYTCIHILLLYSYFRTIIECNYTYWGNDLQFWSKWDWGRPKGFWVRIERNFSVNCNEMLLNICMHIYICIYM